jgi:hypothetical protein
VPHSSLREVTHLSSRLLILAVFLIGFLPTVVSLVDSGANLNLIHESRVSMLNIPTEPCSQSISIDYLDASSSI